MNSHFQAQDGISFVEKSPFDLDQEFSFSQKQNESLTKESGEIDGGNFVISYNRNCEVRLMDRVGDVNIEQLDQCRIVVGACSGVVSIRNCTNCVFYVACAQFEMFDCTGSSIYLFCMSSPLIERSVNIEIAPFYDLLYSEQLQHILDSGLDPSENKWNQVISETNSSSWQIIHNEESSQTSSAVSNNAQNFHTDTQNNDISIFDEFNQDYPTGSQDLKQSILHNHVVLDNSYNNFSQHELHRQPEIFAQPINFTQPPEQHRYPESKEKQSHQQIPTVLVDNQSQFVSGYTKQMVQWEEEVRQREELEKKRFREAREIAEQQIDEFYDKRTDKKANQQAKNREQQELEQEKDESKRKEAQNPFVYIADLIDLRSASGSEEVERDRMTSILIQLKQPEVDKMENKNIQNSKQKKTDLNLFQTSL